MPARSELPICGLCGEQQTFFFQVRLNAKTAWRDDSLAVFQCTECADEQHFIPPMLEGRLAGAQVTADFLHSYQRNFRVLPFSSHDDLVLRSDSKERIRFSNWQLTDKASASTTPSFIGGTPEWLQENEAPGGVAGGGVFEFLFQIGAGAEFGLLDSAPGQITLGLDGKPKRSTRKSYQLFLGNQVFFFGAALNSQPLDVYVITQRD